MQRDSPSNVFHDVGFLTSRFGNEDTGFARNRFSTPRHLREVAVGSFFLSPFTLISYLCYRLDCPGTATLVLLSSFREVLVTAKIIAF